MSTQSPTHRPRSRPRRLRVTLSIDFDALSGYIGTGHTPHNTLSDYSSGLLSATTGVPRLLKLLKKYDIQDKVTWFIPGHTAETFPKETRDIMRSGAEIGVHGYSHEGCGEMSERQEEDVLGKCRGLLEGLYKRHGPGGGKDGEGGRKVVGYRAPLYQIRNHTVRLLQQRGFLYDSSMNGTDALPYFLPFPFNPGLEVRIPDYENEEAGEWMVPTTLPKGVERGSEESQKALVEIPGSWYTEDMTPLGFYPYTSSTQGYVSVRVVEEMWWDRFLWIWENESWVDDEDGDEGEEERTGLGEGKGWGSVYPLIWHPESAGRAHVIGMIDRFLERLVEMKDGAGEGEITFETMESVALSWKGR